MTATPPASHTDRVSRPARGSGSAGRALVRDALACGALTLAWLAAAAVIGIEGDFPLNDDWAYAHSAQVLCETGRLERIGWTWAPIVSHALVGALFCLGFGFSFEVLRASGLLMGWLGVLASYGLCRQLGASRRWALLAAAAVGFNPLYLNLSYTYMTDVPFAALATGSCLLLARGLMRHSAGWLAAGGAVALGAILSRQIGLALPAAFACALMVSRWQRPGRRSVALAAVLLAAAAWVVASSAIFTAGDAEGDYPLHRFLGDMLTRPGFVPETLANGVTAAVYLGLFLSPVVAARLSSRGRGLRLAAALCALALAAFAALGWRMPLGVNVLYDFGVGPPTLAGAYDALERAPGWLWWGITALSLASGLYALVLLVGALTRGPADFAREQARVLLLAFVVLVLLPQIASQNFFDRYLLTPLPAAAALLLALPGRSERAGAVGGALAAALLVGAVAWSVAGTRDYLEHNRARWELIALLLERGAPPDRIEAGLEFEGWRTRDDNAAGRYLRRRGKHEAEFVVAHDARLARYRPLASRSFRRWLPPGIETLTAHRRLAPAGGGEP